MDDITSIITNYVRTNYKQVAILAMYGSRAKKTFDARSDLEFFAIVDQFDDLDKDTNFHLELLYNGIPVDAWSTGWRHIEELANVEGYWILPAATIATGKVVYARSNQDFEKFEEIRNRIKDPSSFANKQLDNALVKFREVYGFIGLLEHAIHVNDNQTARDACWNIIINLTIVLAQVNNQYLNDNWGLNLNQVFDMVRKPENFQVLVELMITSDDDVVLRKSAIKLVENTRQLLISINSSRVFESIEYTMLGELGAFAYIDKIRKAVKLKNIFAVGYAIHDLQPLIARDLMMKNHEGAKSGSLIFYKEFKKYYEELGLPDFFDAITKRNWKQITKLADLLEKQLKKHFSAMYENFPHINSIEEFKNYLFQTKP